MKFTPDLLTFENGSPVRTAEDWELRRKELLHLICREEFGYRPAAPKTVTGTVIGTETEALPACAICQTVEIAFDTEKGEFRFPIRFLYPNDNQAHPLILLVSFNMPSFPAEDLIANGFAAAGFAYSDISSDDGDFTSGLAGMFTRTGAGDEWGKIAIWTYAASRALDYLLTREEVDTDNVAICGHSRLGKTALYAGAMDERFRFTLANNSGCGGDALEQTKHEGAETVPYMNGKFSHWFCENHKKYSEMPIWEKIDQHMLVAAIAPRYVAIGSAIDDRWADPYSQQITATAATPAWEILGKRGYVGPAEQINVGEQYAEGCISYHLREGGHSLSTYDWQRYIEFMKKHL
ncbi:MAG: hypothetical protein IJX76_02720 [Clostridia bacterium]|nr:hypothetical protein [Clostridia bacterium]